MKVHPSLAKKQTLGSNAKREFALSVLAAIILTITLPASTFASTPQPASDPAIEGVNQEDLLWWLPPDTETAVAARGPFSFPAPLSERDEEENSSKKKVSEAEIFREFERQPLELLYSQSPDVATPLRGSIVAFAMQGSRRFRDPLPGFEELDFEGCSILVFDNSFGERGRDLMQELAKTATATKMVADIPILVFHQKLGDAEWNFFFALPRTNVLLAANNLPYLQEVVDRMTQRKSPRALLDQLPEWRFLAPAARFWGLRHYDPAQARQDPTSPFSEERTFGPGDKKAVGVLFALESKNRRKAVMTYFSGDEAMIRKDGSAGVSSEQAVIASMDGHEAITRDGMSFEVEPEVGAKYEVKLRYPAPGVLERVYTLDRPGTLSYFMLQMQISLGRGMYF